MKRLSGAGGPSRLTLLLLASSLFPVGVLANWSSSGDNFNGELVVGGQVTNTRNPWSWQMLGGEEGLNVSGSILQRGGNHVWQGLLGNKTLLLGKTSTGMPSGRAGIAPEVTFGIGSEGFSLTWRGDGEADVVIPVYDAELSNALVGHFSFRLVSAAMMKHIRNSQPVYMGMYNDMSGNGLPPRGMMQQPARTGEMLCGMFAGSGPTWLCAGERASDGAPLSSLTDNSITRPEGAYGVQLVAGSGVLLIDGQSPPPRWKATLPVRIEYR